jgi:hypothetical protein
MCTTGKSLASIPNIMYMETLFISYSSEQENAHIHVSKYEEWVTLLGL